MSEKAKMGIVVGVIAILFVLAVITPFSLFFIEMDRETRGEDLNKVVKKYESEWKIDLPSDIKVQYNYIADGVKYSYAKFEKEPAELVKTMKEGDAAFETKFKTDMEKISKEIAVKSVIDFGKSYYYLEKSDGNVRFYVLYFPSAKAAYLYETRV